jgi:hypothetical protein
VTPRRSAALPADGSAAETHLLVLPPLGTRTFSQATLDEYAWQDWEGCDLIAVMPDQPPPSPLNRPEQLKRHTIPLAVFVLGALGGWLLSNVFFTIWFWLALALTTLVIHVTVQGLWRSVQRYLAESLGWIGVAVFGVALPGLFVGVAIQELGLASVTAQDGGQTPVNNLTLVALAVLLLFMPLARPYPAGLYFLFKRQKIWFLHSGIFATARQCPAEDNRSPAGDSGCAG